MTSVKGLSCASIIPPWLWFWLIVYIISLPSNLSNWIQLLKDILAYQNPSSEITGGSLFPLLAITDFLELIIPVILYLDIALLLIPNQRAKRLEREFQLTQPDYDIPAVREIIEFLYKYNPKIRVKTNPLCFDQLVFVYPLGYGKVAIALCGAIIKLWRKDNAIAKAVLLHELAHYHHGDVFIIGVGSIFRKLISHWFPIYLLTVLAPISLVFLSQTITFFQEVGISLPTIIYKASQIILGIPLFLSQMIGLLFLSLNAFILPLVGTWCSEFNADQAAAKVTSYHEVIKAIQQLPAEKSWTRWLLFRLSHPPNKLRQWLLTNSQNWWILFILLSLFPLVYILRVLIPIAQWLPISFLLLNDLDTLRKGIVYYLDNAMPILFSTAILIAAWPKTSHYWESYFSGAKLNSTKNFPWVYYLTAATIVINISILHNIIGGK